jgi:uncharacterized coiled-coil DUF342 family protein
MQAQDLIQTAASINADALSFSNYALTQAAGEIELLKTQLSKAESDTCYWEHQALQRREEIHILQTQLQNCQASSGEVETLRAEIAALKASNDKLERFRNRMLEVSAEIQEYGDIEEDIPHPLFRLKVASLQRSATRCLKRFPEKHHRKISA